MNRIRQFGIVATAFIFVLCTACGDQAADRTRQQSYDDDGYLGMTNTNPNLHTSPTYHNYSSDAGIARQALDRMSEVDRSRVFIQGGTMLVTVRLKGKYTNAAETSRIMEDIQTTLQRLLPRYQIKMNDSAR